MKNVLLASVFLTAFVLMSVGCSESLDLPEMSGLPYVVHAGFEDTKTVNDGLKTRWVAGDAISLFHAPAGCGSYIPDGKFVIDSDGLDKGIFSGDLSEPLGDGTFDWYAVYPYCEESDTPSELGNTVAVGLPLNAVQDGYDSMAHLCGDVCPLYGVAYAVQGENVPRLVMKHMTSVVRVDVTNGTEEDVVLEKVSFTASENIAGLYHVELSSGAPVYYEKGSEYVSESVSVDVKNAGTLPSGASASVYLAVKPFVASAGTELLLSVNGMEKKVCVEDDVVFSEGKIKTLKFTLQTSESEEDEPVRVTLEGSFLYSDLTNGKSLSKINESNGRISLDKDVTYKNILDQLGMSNSEFVNSYVSHDYDVKFFDAQGRQQYGKADPYDPSSSPYPAGIGWNTAWSYKDEVTQDPLCLILYDAIAQDAAGSVVFTFSSSLGPDVIITFKYAIYPSATGCAWPAFNPDVALTEKENGMTVIEVKGKRGDDGKWEMSSELKEHFRNYLSDFESPANHGELCFAVSAKSEDAPVVITGSDWTDQQIKLNAPLEGEEIDVVVEAYMMLVNGSRCSMEYLVRFVNPFEAVLEEVELKTLMASPDTADLLESLVVKDRDGKAVYEDGAVTEYGKDVYLFEDDDILPEFTCEPDASFGGNLALLPDGHTLEWYNSGTTLQRDKSTVYGVRVSVSDIAVVKSTGKVVVLSSENSK